MQWPSWASGCRCIHVNSAEMASRRTVVETEERRTKLACTDVETTPGSVWGHTQLRWVVACVNIGFLSSEPDYWRRTPAVPVKGAGVILSLAVAGAAATSDGDRRRLPEATAPARNVTVATAWGAAAAVRAGGQPAAVRLRPPQQCTPGRAGVGSSTAALP